MDKTEAAVNAIRLINQTAENKNLQPAMIEAVCTYFDLMKDSELSQADRLFLHYLANKAGLPQYYYYPILKTGNVVDEDVCLQTFSNYVQESSYVVGEGVMLHRYQKEILDSYEKGRRNRYFLSAATSFGKTFLIYEIIRKMQYANVALIFPTISLLSENLFKIHLSEEYKWIKENYKIHTLSDVTDLGERNLFIYTPERFLSFADKNDGVNLDFVFVDEVYKLDNGFIIDEVQQENERDVAYRIALHELLKEDNTDALLAGPYIVLSANAEREKSSFKAFLDWYGFSVRDYNKYDIVNKKEFPIKSASVIKVDDTFRVEFKEKTKKARFVQLVTQLISRNENTIVYCSQKATTESYAKELLDADVGLVNVNDERLHMLTNHIDNLFADGKGKQWIVSKALKKGIGIHHGLIPKYIQQEIISLFNSGILKVLICTTTITEGVNTTAKNIIVLSGKKGNKALKKFDAQNIEGRAGRFLKHYTGRVFIMDNDFTKCLKEEDEPLQHKLFDKNVDKKDVDLVITGKEYLSQAQENRKNELDQQRDSGRMPQACFDAFRTVSYADKLFLYDMISRFSDSDRGNIRELIRKFSASRKIHYPGLQLICQSVRSFIKNDKLRFYFEEGAAQRSNCYMVDMISAFISKGFAGSANYYIKKEDNVDIGIRKAAEFVFNMLRYQVVKYFGLFNLIYKNFESVRTGVDIDDITGIESLLLRLEYNADTQLGRRASDIGASFRVVKYYDYIEQNPNNKGVIDQRFNQLDDFEKYNVLRIKKIL